MARWDTGGADMVRPLWPWVRPLCPAVDGIVFVVDASDHDRLGTAADELAKMLAYDELQFVPLLVLANKPDRPGALPAAEVAAALSLHALRRCPARARSSVATLHHRTFASHQDLLRHFVLLYRSTPDSLTCSAAPFLNRRCGRTLGGAGISLPTHINTFEYREHYISMPWSGSQRAWPPASRWVQSRYRR
jgi:hypothetical protein